MSQKKKKEKKFGSLLAEYELFISGVWLSSRSVFLDQCVRSIHVYYTDVYNIRYIKCEEIIGYCCSGIDFLRLGTVRRLTTALLRGCLGEGRVQTKLD